MNFEYFCKAYKFDPNSPIEIRSLTSLSDYIFKSNTPEVDFVVIFDLNALSESPERGIHIQKQFRQIIELLYSSSHLSSHFDMIGNKTEKLRNVRLVLKNAWPDQDIFQISDELLEFSENSPGSKYKANVPDPIVKEFFDFLKENQHLIHSDALNVTLWQILKDVEAEVGNDSFVISKTPKFQEGWE